MLTDNLPSLQPLQEILAETQRLLTLTKQLVQKANDFFKEEEEQCVELSVWEWEGGRTP